MPSTARYAIYYAPEPDDPLWVAGCLWLGRDPERDVQVAQISSHEFACHATSPRRYGFHATLKAPMQIRDGAVEDFLSSVDHLSCRMSSFELPRLNVAGLGDFLALRPMQASPALGALASAFTVGLDQYRLAEPEALVAQRSEHCTPRQRELLHRWGYPFVLEEWRFHMTLSDHHPPPGMRVTAEAFFEKPLSLRRQVTSICVFREEQRRQPFKLVKRFPFRGSAY